MPFGSAEIRKVARVGASWGERFASPANACQGIDAFVLETFPVNHGLFLHVRSRALRWMSL